MTTTTIRTRGRHRRSFWLGFGPVALALILLALLLAPTAAAAPVQAEYGGSRWGHADRAVCVTIKNIKTTAVRDAVKRSVARWNDNTVLRVITRNDCYTSGYSQRIVVYDRHYDWKASGKATLKGGYEWTQVDTAGPWTVNGWTYVHRSPVIVRINRTYTDGMTSGMRQHVVSHELGHALGLGHTSSCKSVLVSHWKCDPLYKYGGWWDWTGTASNPGINKLYGQG